MSGPQLEDDVDALCATALQEPAAGVTLWVFHTRDVDRALEPDEVVKLITSGKGVYVVELVWTDDDELVQRGKGRVLRTGADVKKLIRERVQHLGDRDADQFG